MKTNELEILTGHGGKNLSRRALMKRLLAGMAAGAAFPLLGEAGSIYGNFVDHSVLDRADAELGAVAWKPIFLNAQQDAALGALAEQIVPGSEKAQSHRFIDLLLSVDLPERQQKFLAALAAMDAAAEKAGGKTFSGLSVAQQAALLTTASARKGAPGYSAELYGHFAHLKGWISGAYYSSEMGMRELGWTENRVFATYPGCTHSEGHS